MNPEQTASLLPREHSDLGPYCLQQNLPKYISRQEKLSDLGPYYLQYRLPKYISRQEKQTTKVVTGKLRLNSDLRSISLI